MFLIVWQFKIKPDKEKRFVEIYHADGRWAEFFRESSAYQGTVLVKSTHDEHTYLTLDYWDTEQEYRDFLKDRADEYATIDRECENLTELETKIGEYATP